MWAHVTLSMYQKACETVGRDGGYAVYSTLAASILYTIPWYLMWCVALIISTRCRGRSVLRPHHMHYCVANVLKMVSLLSNMAHPAWWKVLHTFATTGTLSSEWEVWMAEALMVNFVTMDAIGLILAAIPIMPLQHTHQSSALVLHHAFTVGFVTIVVAGFPHTWINFTLAKIIVVYGVCMTPTGIVNGLQGVRKELPRLYNALRVPVAILYKGAMFMAIVLCAGISLLDAYVPVERRKKYLSMDDRMLDLFSYLGQTIVGWWALSVFMDQDWALYKALVAKPRTGESATHTTSKQNQVQSQVQSQERNERARARV